jgi:3D (Asp-Asp-Asp) domain-containing protein
MTRMRGKFAFCLVAAAALSATAVTSTHDDVVTAPRPIALPTTSELEPVPPPMTTTPTPKPTSSTPTPNPMRPPPKAVPNAFGAITYYAARDNDPPGSREIAYPGTFHSQAGGTGSFGDPLTFAAAAGQFKPGTRVYVPQVKRYFVLEDTCAGCAGSHIDLWAGPSTDPGVIDCEDNLTRDGASPYVVNPPNGLPVSSGDLYRAGRCYRA